MTTLSPYFLNGSFLFLQVTRNTIKAGLTLILGHIQPPTLELAAIERQK